MVVKPEDSVANGGRRTKRKRVHEQPFSIHIRELARALVPGEIKQTRLFGLFITCNLSSDEPFLEIHLPRKFNQSVGLISRPAGRGQRWFFKERSTGIVCEKLYLMAQGYKSRQSAGLAYASQLQNSAQRKLTRAKKVHSAIAGTKNKGPARGRSKFAKLQELKELTEELRKYQVTLQDPVQQKA